MKKWVFSDDAWRRQLRELERRLTKSDLKRNPNQILLPHTITLEVKYNKNTQYSKNVVWILRTNQKSRFWSYFQGIWHRTDRFQAVTQVEGPLHQMSWPVQIKEVFDVLQSSPDSILDPADPEIKMHLLRTNLVNSAFWTWQQIKKPDLTQKNFDWPIWEPLNHFKVLPPFLLWSGTLKQFYSV